MTDMQKIAAPPPSSAPASWQSALAASRNGNIAVAREICAELSLRPPPFAGGHELLLGRCLAEAGADAPEAVDLLLRARELAPENLSIPHALALALLRAGRSSEAAVILKNQGLPHDSSLLAQIALMIESEIRPWPERLPNNWPDWPAQWRETALPEPTPAQDTAPTSIPVPILPIPPIPPIPKLTRGQKRELGKRLIQIESDFMEYRTREAMIAVNEAMDAGLEDPSLHFVAGLAAEQGGDGPRARRHLARLLDAEPNAMLGRAFLARVYWRNGWNDLAEDLWRSIPIEGPDDYGRHYGLALAHEAAGRHADALAAMQLGLRDFFMETREFHLERAFQRWLAFVG